MSVRFVHCFLVLCAFEILFERLPTAEFNELREMTPCMI